MKGTQLGKMREILRRVKPRGRVLDVACGPGFLRRFVKNAVFTDYDLDYLQGFDGDRVLADANQLPFKDCAFDTVFCIDFIHLMRNRNELERVVSNGGTLVLSAYSNRFNFQSRLLWLRGLFPRMDALDSFVAKAEAEWDSVVILRKAYK